ncbi:MAG: HAD hydrolase-like protein, partial [Gammaproteobacteria bacterium]
EEIILDELLEFLGRRLFGPQRLRLLREELARSVAESWHEHDTQLARMRLELEDIDRSLYRQSLRLEEHDDANHPVVALATRRIEELSARRTSIEETIRNLEARRPDGARPNPLMIRSVLNALEANSEYTAMIGDRMNTDIVAGLETTHVLSGLTGSTDAERHPYLPSRVVRSVADLIDELG